MKNFRWILILIAGFMMSIGHAAADTYVVDPAQSQIQGAIGYTLIGKYQAAFEHFEGNVKVSADRQTIEDVYLKIDTSSVKSKFSALDKIVRSPRILDAKKYPSIIFQSRDIKMKNGRWAVKGDITLHGITKTMEFVFDADLNKKVGKFNAVSAKGQWVIARKEFDVIWNKVLDQGGIIVGDHITVNWNVTALALNSRQK